MAVTKKKKKKPTIILQVEIIAPDMELAKSGECYATLQRKIILPFVPFVGLHLGFEPLVSDEQESRYAELFALTMSKTRLFDIERVAYYIDRQEFHLSARSQFEPTIEQFHALKEYLIAFYGFRAL